MALIILAVCLCCIAVWLGGGTPRHYRFRSCQGQGWRRAFPAASKKQIREFLALFSEAFAFRDSDKLKFSPGDNLLQIYRRLHPQRWLPDALEFETLAADLKQRYALDLNALWSDQLTLGELFDRTLHAPQKRQTASS